MNFGIATFQLDEGRLLQSWIEHHASIFGFNNLVVIDNGSTDSLTLQILNKAVSNGVKVFHFPGNSSFENKGKLVPAVMSGFRDQIDWFLPVDVDEFLVCKTNNQESFSSRKEDVFVELERIAGIEGAQAAQILKQIVNVSGTSFGYLSDRRRLILLNKTTHDLDVGFHGIDGVSAESLPVSDLSLIHFHDRGWEDSLKRARLKLSSRVARFDEEHLTMHFEKKGLGFHLAPLFYVNSIEDYKKRRKNPDIDLTPLLQTEEEVPFSIPLPVDSGAIRVLRDPVNLHHHQFAGSREELAMLREQMRNVSSYLEYGAGGSTVLACDADIESVTSVETDRKFLKKLVDSSRLGQVEYLRKRIKKGQLRIFHSNLGETKEWGYPVSPPSSNKLKKYYKHLRSLNDLELIFLDGRYRVAAAAAAWINQPTAKLIVHDYFFRSYYKDIEEIWRLEEHVGSLAVFSRLPRKQLAAQQIFENHFDDPR